MKCTEPLLIPSPTLLLELTDYLTVFTSQNIFAFKGTVKKFASTWLLPFCPTMGSQFFHNFYMTTGASQIDLNILMILVTMSFSQHSCM